ncbi:hypothetical protein [Cobetia marina]|uniref:C2H2-type domain-containing protein n=1 Tax=Cobetia marina TaxID=28258 RepID=A0ABU9GE96_COBMA|nr:hypothetical protein [Cobetia marina]GED41839.1 hypothetical protein HHA02_11680 [Cobetia marina]
MRGYRFCTQCGGASVHRIKRHWWQRLIGLPPRYHCEDCGVIDQVSDREHHPALHEAKPGGRASS